MRMSEKCPNNNNNSDNLFTSSRPDGGKNNQKQVIRLIWKVPVLTYYLNPYKK